MRVKENVMHHAGRLVDVYLKVLEQKEREVDKALAVVTQYEAKLGQRTC